MLPKSLPRPVYKPRRSKWMTLVAGFRSRNGGILLCADREENDGYGKREVDKIYRVQPLLPQCEVFIAGAGSAGVIANANLLIEEAFWRAEASGNNLLNTHRDLLQSTLEIIYEKYVKTSDDEIGLIIVVAFRESGRNPLLYSTQSRLLIPVENYVSQGTGKSVSDYLADQLYKYGTDRRELGLLAAFIFREAENSSAGVSFGPDMQFIFDGDRSFRNLGADNVKNLKNLAPSLRETIWSHWAANVKFPEDLAKAFD